MKFKIDHRISEKYPHLIANVAIIKRFNNNPSSEVSEKILMILRESEELLRKQFTDKDLLMNHPYVTSYLEFFRSFGVNPKKVKPSHVALTDRVVRGGSLPDINPAVNLYNAFSIRNITPFGGEDLNKVEEYFELTIANGDESWLGIGEEEAISPRPEDIIWRDKTDVSTLSMNWRQCEKTKLTEESTNGYFIMEGFDDVNQENILKNSKDFIETFTSLLGGIGTSYLLTKENPEVIVD